MRILIVLLSVGLFTSCSMAGKTALAGPQGRTAYNAAIQNTTSQQLLLNLVRLRYCDIPYFLDVTNVTTQFNFSRKANASVLIPGFNQDNPVSLGGDILFEDRPTIQYTPLEGHKFATQLMHPISLRIIQNLIFTGWDVDSVFRLMLQSLDDVPNAVLASSPQPDQLPNYEKFFEITSLLRHFQLLGQFHMGVSHVDTSEENEFTSHDMEKEPNQMQLIFPAEGKDAERLAFLLEDAKKVDDKYILNINLGYNKKAEIGIMPRSVMGCMYYLSLGVDVPQIDIDEGNVPVTKVDGKNFDWGCVINNLISIKNCKGKPKNAFISAYYRGTWFYIPNNDIRSKRTFVLLQQLYNLQAIQVQQQPNLLSIPLG